MVPGKIKRRVGLRNSGSWMGGFRYHSRSITGSKLCALIYCCSLVEIVIPFYLPQALLLLSQMSPEVVGDPVDVRRLYDAVDFLLYLQVTNLI